MHNSGACYLGSLQSVWSTRRFHTHPEHVWERFLADKVYVRSQQSMRICGAALINKMYGAIVSVLGTYR